MNQIIQEPFNLNSNRKAFSATKLSIEFGNEIAEIPYGGNYKITASGQNSKLQTIKKFIKKRKYQLQFIVSTLVAIIFLVFLFVRLYKTHQQEKIAQELLNNYQLTTLYSDTNQYSATRINDSITQSPFVIGMIKIDKIELNYPILSESNDELLKISLCRFTGPLPNEEGNLCIAGHNYVDSSFFSRLDELEIGDLIEVYDLSGERQDYYVYKKYEVDANDLSCTSQDVGDSKIITLLTCDNSNNSKRLVVQAK